MAKKQRKKKATSAVWKNYEVKDNKLVRKNSWSLKAGTGVFMANHKDRKTCGQTGYTEFKSKEEKKE